MRVRGNLSWNPKGFAFVISPGEKPDIFIPPGDLNGALDGDLVEVEAYPDSKGFRGWVISIVERNHQFISGRYRRMKKWGVIDPYAPFPYTVIIPRGAEGLAKSGDRVVARLEPPLRSKKIKTIPARIAYVIKIPKTIGDDLKFVAAKHGLSWMFPREVESQANKVAELDMELERQQRRDLTDRVLFTIDGIRAKDFDDALGIDALPDGTYRLTVAIADVASLVKEGSILDKQACLRGFSVYFPEVAIPMLPEVLSNGVLSLQPDEDRLAVVVEMHLGPRGKLVGYDCYDAVIRSRARLTYEALGAFIEGSATAPTDNEEINIRVLMLHKMARYLYAARKKQGSLDFDLPEVGFSIERSGMVGEVFRKMRNPAERLIEESMLLTNKVVCMFLQSKGLPVLYRIHESPLSDDLIALSELMKHIGVDNKLVSDVYKAVTKGTGIHEALQNIIDEHRGKPQEGFVNQHVLRALKQARYSHQDLGHFGLACKGYLHFTSPIRRYPDLIIHRIVKMAFAGQSSVLKKKFSRYLKYMGAELSRAERRIDNAAFEVIKLKTASYMSRHIGEVFRGVVTSILRIGLFVELLDPPCDGLIPLSDLARARVTLNRSIQLKKRTICIGDIIQVRVTRVDLTQGLIDLSLHA